jgi:alpha-tubulin suppressor-like RCC1 family protein
MALRTDGTLWAWGSNDRGQLGNGAFYRTGTGGTNTPQQIGTNADWQAIEAGALHSVALRADGTLWAWGYNEYGQLGIGTFSTNDPRGINTPQRVGTDTNWVAVAAGYHHTVGLRADGTLWAWGMNEFGALGNGMADIIYPYASTNTPQRVGTNSDWQAIAAGGSHTVGLRADGTLWGWGWNRFGQLGNGAFETNAPQGATTPQQIGTNADWLAIAAGDSHTVALRASRTLWAWGNNNAGQLGNGTFTNSNTPQQIGSDTNWQAIAAGVFHTLALHTNGTLWAWGLNQGGELGIGSFSTNSPPGMNTPQQVGTNTNWGPPP